jgi:large subunit ribosomal protein L25
MPDTNTLKIEARGELRKRNRQLRAAGKVPGVIYGRGVESVSVTLGERDFMRTFHKVGRTQLLDLVVNEDPARRVLVREVQYDPRTGRLFHIDFYQVNLKEKISADVPILIVGEAPAVQRAEGELQQNLHSIRVNCLPADIPEHFECDVSGLEAVDDAVRVAQIVAPPEVEILNDPEEVVAKVAHIKVIVEEEPEVEAVEGEEAAAAEGAEGVPAEGEAKPEGGDEAGSEES